MARWNTHTSSDYRDSPFLLSFLFIPLIVSQLLAFYRLYKKVRLKKWRQLSNTDKFYKAIDSLSWFLVIIFAYLMIYVETDSWSWFFFALGCFYVAFVAPRLGNQVTRIDGFLTSDDSPQESLDSGSEESDS